MDDRTLGALKGSIAKWEAIVAGTGKDHGEDNCPLCRIFIDKGCAGCPVKHATGKECCVDSPYDAYCAHPTKRHAQAELDFLRSLLPNTAASSASAGSTEKVEL